MCVRANRSRVSSAAGKVRESRPADVSAGDYLVCGETARALGSTTGIVLPSRLLETCAV